MILIVKCGNPDEQGKPKAGNRGKRDSQLILMNFFSRVTYNDRMTPLDYDLFRKIQYLMGVTPDYFELVLMVIIILFLLSTIYFLLTLNYFRWMLIQRFIHPQCACW
jgi:hypothetical protein